MKVLGKIILLFGFLIVGLSILLFINYKFIGWTLLIKDAEFLDGPGIPFFTMLVSVPILLIGFMIYKYDSTN